MVLYKCDKHNYVSETDLCPQCYPVTKSIAEDADLLSCPFCGSPAKMFHDQNNKNWGVVCQHPECLCNARILYCHSKEEAIQQWNRRVRVKFCFINCKYLSITEMEQNNQIDKENHKCKRYNKRVFHCDAYPFLYMLNECDYDGQ